MERSRSYEKLHAGKRRSFNSLTTVRMRVAHAIRLGKTTHERIAAARDSEWGRQFAKWFRDWSTR